MATTLSILRVPGYEELQYERNYEQSSIRLHGKATYLIPEMVFECP